MKANFKITARVVSQLGIELISSDEIAIYELVKNGFDAGSRIVEINVNHRIDVSIIQQVTKLLAGSESDSALLNSPLDSEKLNEAISRLLALCSSVQPTKGCILTASELDVLANELKSSKTPREFSCKLGKINSIDIVDYGSGMTPDEVEKYYLTIGTTHRLQQLRQITQLDQGTEVPAGEKGIGRLSSMRLGRNLDLLTIPKNDANSSMVSIDWTDFELLMDKDLNEVSVDFEVKDKGGSSAGTIITISNLTSPWHRDKVVKLAAEHLAKFIDPFPQITSHLDSPSPSIKADQTTKSLSEKVVILRWNGEVIDATSAIRPFLENCINSFACKLQIQEGQEPQLFTEFRFAASGAHAAKHYNRIYTTVDFSEITKAKLKEVGPFEFVLYHYPRNRLKPIPLVATRVDFKSWLDKWCGGLMVFRDGVRVMPYASHGDDWLNLDSKALRGQGFRVNRIQVVGFVRISRLANPQLIDQTNREGLRDNSAFRTFTSIIERHILGNFVSALNEQMSDSKAEIEHLALRVQQQCDAITTASEKLTAAITEKNWEETKASAEETVKIINGFRELNSTVEKALTEKESSRVDILELAATGMSAESMAHDLEGAIESSIATLGELSRHSKNTSISGAVNHLRAVHKSLLTQLKQISPGPAKSRRRPSTFDLIQVAREAEQLYQERCGRHGISFHLPKSELSYSIYAVNGHIRLIMDNLIRNSIFWLSDTKDKFPDLNDYSISIEMDVAAGEFRFRDSGVGIALEDVDWVFRPFTTHRSDGRGLGLFIVKELAEFNSISIRLDTTKLNSWGRASTFVLDVGSANKKT